VTDSEFRLETAQAEKKWGKRETMPWDCASKHLETETFGILERKSEISCHEEVLP